MLRGHAMSLFYWFFSLIHNGLILFHSVTTVELCVKFNLKWKHTKRNLKWQWSPSQQLLYTEFNSLSALAVDHQTLQVIVTLSHQWLSMYVDCIYFYYLANRGACMVKYREALRTMVLLALELKSNFLWMFHFG